MATEKERSGDSRGRANGRKTHLACAAEEEEDKVDIMRYK